MARKTLRRYEIEELWVEGVQYVPQQERPRTLTVHDDGDWIAEVWCRASDLPPARQDVEVQIHAGDISYDGPAEVELRRVTRHKVVRVLVARRRSVSGDRIPFPTP